VLKRILSIFKRPSPEEIAQDLLRDLLKSIDKMR